MGSFTRGFMFEDRLYAGLMGLTTNQLASYYGSSWSFSSSGGDSFLYFTEAWNNLFISSGSKVLRRETYHNAFWEYQEETESWSEVQDAESPSPREGFGIAFDKHNSIIILFGGADESRYYGDTYIYSKTVGSGVFTSTTFDSGDTPLETHWQSLSWTRANQPSGSSIRFQLASNNDNTTWTYKGPDGTAGSYYSNPVGEAIWTGHQGDRFLRFRAYFNTTSSLGPVLDRVEITYDHTPAKPGLTEPLDNVWTDDNSPRFTWSFDDFDSGDYQSGFRVLISDNLSFDEIAFDSGNQDGTNEYWQLPSSLADGIWFWKVRTKDGDGIWGEYSTPFTLKIDTEAPSSAITDPVSSSYLNSIGFINGTSSDTHSGVDSGELLLMEQGDTYWDGSSWQSQEYWHPCAGTVTWSFDTSSVNWISEREYTVTTRATDVAGNMETPTSTTTFIYDTTQPSVTLLNPVGSESPEGGKNIEIKWTASDAYLNASSVQIGYSIDGGTTWNSIAESETNDGSHNWTLPRMKSDMRIRVEAQDFAGNVGQDMSGVFYVRAPEDEEDWLRLYWWLILIVVLVAISLAIYYWRKISAQPEEEMTGPPPIVATAGETTLCAVCLGTVKEGLSVIKCGDCGKTFHEKCAARIEKCPNCDSKLDMSELEEE